MAKVICVANPLGGTRKTSILTDVACATIGKSLLIDLDPKHDLTQWLMGGTVSQVTATTVLDGIYNRSLVPTHKMSGAIKPTTLRFGEGNGACSIDFLPAGTGLLRIQDYFSGGLKSSLLGIPRLFKLYRPHYDCIFVNMGCLTQNMTKVIFTSCDFFFVISSPSRREAEGLKMLSQLLLDTEAWIYRNWLSETELKYDSQFKLPFYLGGASFGDTCHDLEYPHEERIAPVVKTATFMGLAPVPWDTPLQNVSQLCQPKEALVAWETKTPVSWVWLPGTAQPHLTNRHERITDLAVNIQVRCDVLLKFCQNLGNSTDRRHRRGALASMAPYIFVTITTVEELDKAVGVLFNAIM